MPGKKSLLIFKILKHRIAAIQDTSSIRKKSVSNKLSFVERQIIVENLNETNFVFSLIGLKLSSWQYILYT